MIVILKQDQTGDITGWMIGPDTHELRYRAEMSGDTALAGELYRWEFPAKGKHRLLGTYTMLVD